MNTTRPRGLGRSQASSKNSPSVSSEVVEMLHLIERMEDILIDQSRNKLCYGGQGRFFSNINLMTARSEYRNASYSIEQVRVYLLRLPVLDETFANICDGIQINFWNSRVQIPGDWHLFLKRAEQTGTLAWQKVLDAITSLLTTYHEDIAVMVAALTHKFAVVDEILDEIHRELRGKEREVRFSVELGDSVEAALAIGRQGGVLTAETIRNFKAAIRMKRAAEEAQWTGSQQESGVEDSQLRHRRNALDGQSARESQDEAEDQAGSTSGSETNTSHQYNPTVLTFVILLIIAAACLTGFAWTKADHSVGSYDDPDFWLLLQSSILQLAGMAPVVLSLWLSKGVSLQPRLWSWILVVSGALCSVLAPALYAAVPKEFSGLVAYVSGMAQAFIVLEAMFLANRAVKQNGAKEKAG